MDTCGSDESPAGVVEAAAAAADLSSHAAITANEKQQRQEGGETTTTPPLLEEWIFGIEDRSIASWKKQTPLFEERIRATNHHTFLDVITELCKTVVRKRRLGLARPSDNDDHDSDDDDNTDDDDDCGVDDHLWQLKFHSSDYKPFDPLEDDPDDDDDESEEAEVVLRIAHALAEDLDYQDENVHDISAESNTTNLSTTLLPLGHVGTFKYDFTNTTELYLKVLSVRTIDEVQQEKGEEEEVVLDKDKKHFGYFVDAGDQASNERDLFSMEAYHMDKEEQIDAFYPNFARACLGKGVPLYQSRPDVSWATGKLTMGLSSKVSSEMDTTFCTIEDSSNSNDLMFCPDVMDLTTLFATCEEAWAPKTTLPQDDPEELYRYQYGWISRFVLDEENQKGIEHVRVLALNEWGPKILVTTTSENIPPDKDFDFESVFPQTAAQLTSGKFRWFSYNRNGVLRVMVGRAGPDRSIRDASQVLRTWKQEFHSLHELLCAVEASWIMNDKPLDATTFLPDFDANLGPSRPGPIEPPRVASESDAVVLSSPNSKKKLVTALSLAKEANKNKNGGDLVVYCGHDDGTLAKWHLESGKLLFREQIYPGGPMKYGCFDQSSSDYSSLDATAGVAGLIVQEQNDGMSDGDDAEHILYTWTHAPTDAESDDCQSSQVKAWSGKDCAFIKSYSCNVGKDEKGNPANPTISCAVFCRLMGVNGDWHNTLVVGLHCVCPSTLYGNGDYSSFNLEKAQSIGEGNILPFNVDSGVSMDTWRGHNGMIRALAVIPDKYLFSYSIRPGAGLADAMILWDLKRPGVPLNRLNLWNPNVNFFMKQSLSRLHGVVGISAHGNNVVLASEYGYQVAVVAVEDKSGKPIIRVCGYGSLCPRDGDGNYHGYMTMSGPVAAMSSNDFRKTWLFNIDDLGSHPKLDCREGNKFDFDKAADDKDAKDEDKVDPYTGRHLVRGVVDLPDVASNRLNGGWGDGPVVLSIRGKYLAAGYADGAVIHVKLPDDFGEAHKNSASGFFQEDGLTSCSWLLSDAEWKRPILWHDKEIMGAWSPFTSHQLGRYGIASDSDSDDDDDSSNGSMSELLVRDRDSNGEYTDSSDDDDTDSDVEYD